MTTAAENRRANLELLVAELGTLEAVAAAGQTSSIYLSQIRNRAVDSDTGRPRDMGPGIARRLEEGTKKPRGWMDEAHPASPAASPPSNSHQTPPTLDRALLVVLDELQGLSPSRWAAVRAVLDQVVTRPDLVEEAAAELLHLLAARPDKRPGAG